MLSLCSGTDYRHTFLHIHSQFCVNLIILLQCRLSEISDEQIILLDHFVTSSNSASSQPEVMYRRFVQKVRNLADTS